MDPETFYVVKTYKILEEALDEIENNYDHLKSIDLCVLPPDLNEMSDDEELDEDNIEDQYYISMDTSDPSQDELGEGKGLSKEYAVFGKPQWSKKDLPSCTMKTSLVFDEDMKEIKDLRELSPREIFEKFLSDEIISYICEQSIIYARQKNNHSFTVEPQEMQTFFAILYLTGYNKFPREHLYWSLDEDLGVPCVYNAMSRGRYLEIKKFLHLADNAKIGDLKDRMYKIRPLADKLIEKFCQWGCFHKDISIDESVVKYFSPNLALQFVRHKPVRFGYKSWTISSSTGYCYGFDFYSGEKSTETEDTKGLSLGDKFVLNLLKNLPEQTKNKILFDNKKSQSKTSKSKDNIVQPKLFPAYNSGVNPLDQCISSHHISIKSKKWWWVLFTYFLDVTMTNAWKVYQISSKTSISQFEFRRSIVQSYLRDAIASKTQKNKKNLNPALI